MAKATDEKPYIVGFVLDFETGGLKAQTCAATQIAVHAIRLDTFEKLGSFVRYIYPYNQREVKALSKRKTLKSKYDTPSMIPMEYQQNALDYSAITMDMLYSQGVELNTVVNDLYQWMLSVIPPKTPKNMKPLLIGQNIKFDINFLLQIFEYADMAGELKNVLRGGEDYYGHYIPESLDTIHIAQLALCHKPEVSSYKLELVCELLDIELDDAHDADADVAATANVAAVLSQRMRSIGGEIDGDEIQMNKAEKSRKHFKI